VPAIEGLLRNAIQEDTAISLDTVLLDSNPATVVRPAGILNGVVGLTPTPGGGFNATLSKFGYRRVSCRLESRQRPCHRTLCNRLRLDSLAH
jgi:hypothetical protein